MSDTPLPNAPFWKRLFSLIYDIFILTALSLLYFAVVTALETVVFNNPPEAFKPNASGAFEQLGWVITLFTFYCFFWLKVGQTVAMKAWRLKTVPTDTNRLTLRHCLWRCVAGFISLAAFGLGYLWILVDKENLALHDRLSKTRVILLPKGQS